MENSWNSQSPTTFTPSAKLLDSYCFLQEGLEMTTSNVFKVKSKKKDFIIALKVDNNKDRK